MTKVLFKGTDYPIQPVHINTDKGVHFWNAFGQSESEVSAKWLVMLAKALGGWYPFTYDEIEAYYRTVGGYTNFWFNKLVTKHKYTERPWNDEFVCKSGDWIVHYDEKYYFTDSFVDNCYASSPAPSYRLS